MCYYNGQRVTREEYIRLKNLEKSLAGFKNMMHPVVNGFNYGQSLVLRKVPDQKDFIIDAMEWGFIPSYLSTMEDVKNFRRGHKDAKGVSHKPMTTLNAMAEEMLLPGKMFRNAALSRRCLVLSTGIFEWRHEKAFGKKGQELKTPAKYPYHIHLKDQPYFFMAGVWQPFEDKQTGERVDTFAIVTTDANGLMAKVHNSKKRMPTILPEDLAFEWLMEDISEQRIAEIARFQYPYEKMEAYTIRDKFQDTEEPTEPFEYEGLTAFELC